MSQENVQVLRSVYEAFNRRDYDKVAELVHPDVVFVRPGAEPSLTGSDAFRAWMEPETVLAVTAPANPISVIEPLVTLTVAPRRSPDATTEPLIKVRLPWAVGGMATVMWAR